MLGKLNEDCTMKICNYLFFLFFLAFSFVAKAQNILPNITNSIGPTATNNIIKAERIFCYNVSSQGDNYKGYTIDNMAIEGFCGIVDENLKGMLLKQLLSTKENIDFNIFKRSS